MRFEEIVLFSYYFNIDKLIGLLQQALDKEWISQGRSGDPPKIIIQGCEDHLLNLMSKDYERYLIENCHPNILVNAKQSY